VMVAANMRRTAHLAARTGEHDVAISLLQSMQEQIDQMPPPTTNEGRTLYACIGRRTDDETRHADSQRSLSALGVLERMPEHTAEQPTPLRRAIEAMVAKHGTHQLLSVVDPKESWRLRVAARLLSEDVPWPWPPTIVRLCTSCSPAAQGPLVDCLIVLCTVLFGEYNAMRGKLLGSHDVPVLVLLRKNTHLWIEGMTKGSELQLRGEQGLLTERTIPFTEAVEVLPCGGDGCGALLRAASLVGHSEMVRVASSPLTGLHPLPPLTPTAPHPADVAGAWAGRPCVGEPARGRRPGQHGLPRSDAGACPNPHPNPDPNSG
jgi:hypothetical protein